ncbi:MAG: hypothetical protein ACE5HF_10570, partial [Gemmatimonadota bacterium]
CTPCCKRKRRDPGSMPAARRYLSRRIRFVSRESRRLSVPFLILSGRFGLLDPDEGIPWYDERLTEGKVGALVPIVAGQLAARHVTAIAFYARPRPTEGWGPYYEVLERACRECRIPMRVESLGAAYL